MFDWIRENEQLRWGLGVFSIACFVLSLIAIPALIVRLPADYFAHARRTRREPAQHPALRMTLLVTKNVMGAVLVFAGVAMLILPGQGILTILIGLFLMSFPGKRRLERGIVRQPAVHAAMNWIRKKAGVPPLEL